MEQMNILQLSPKDKRISHHVTAADLLNPFQFL